jgi:hypothetical protein
MRRILAGTIVTLAALSPSPAVAQERAADAALGAVSGAVVLGPVGAVAGAIVGYTAGPSIARAWGLRGDPRPARPVKPSARPVRATSSKAVPSARAASAAPSPARAQAAAPPARPGPRAQGMPPVQAFE